MRALQFSRAGLVSLLALGCSAQTQLVLSVDTDYVVPGGLDELVIEVTGPSGTMREARQPLSASGDLPHTLTVVPKGEALGPVDIRVNGLLDGTVVVFQDARVTLQAGQSLALTVFLHEDCEGVTCGDEQTCRCGACGPRVSATEPWVGEPGGDPCNPAADAGVADAAAPDGAIETVDGGAADGGPGPACVTDADCDDGVPCTRDTCGADGECVATADDASCTDGTGGACVVGFGCQYDGCSPSTCVAGPCQTATCEGGTCVLAPRCAVGEQCCGGSCVAAGCTDDNPCTDDACGDTGCVHTNNTASCDDGVFCNGGDTCAGGSCSSHAGEPCGGSSVCDEGMSACVGCSTDADCPADIRGSWGGCAYTGGTCDETGTRERTVTSYACVSNVCQPSSTPETESCSRTTTGTMCGSTTFGGWGGCSGYSGTCGESGTRSRTRTDRECSGGTCRDVTTTDSGSCARDTDGVSCGSTTYGGWNMCMGYSDSCDDTTGTRTRSQMTFTCASGSCQTIAGTDTGPCSRPTEGLSCGAVAYGPWGACTASGGTCDTTGTRSRTMMTPTCSSGSCSTVSGTDTEACSIATDGLPCGSVTYGLWSSCSGFSSFCDETGSQTRSTRTPTCSGGACGTVTGSQTRGCTRARAGMTCFTGGCEGICAMDTCEPLSGGICLEPLSVRSWSSGSRLEGATAWSARRRGTRGGDSKRCSGK